MTIRKPKAEHLKRGRPTAYQDDYPQRLLDYGPACDTKAAVLFGVCRETIWDWSRRHPDFGNALRIAKAKRLDDIIDGALTGRYNATFARFLASANHGLVEKTAVDNTHANPDGTPLSIKVEFVRTPNA